MTAAPAPTDSVLGQTTPTAETTAMARKARRTAPRRTERRGGGAATRVVLATPFALLVLLAVVGPSLANHDPERVTGSTSEAPSGTHYLGTDSNGLDVFSRIVTAARLDMTLAISITVLTTVLGLVIGLLVATGESRRGPLGWTARGAGRLVDMVQAVPILIAGLTAASFFGRSPLVIVLALSLSILPYQLRLMRTEVLWVRREGYVDAARLSGEPTWTVLTRYVLPNAARPTLENSSAVFGMAIIFTAGLGFLGVGIPLPRPEWGSMLAAGVSDALVGRWWSALFPAAAIGLSVLSAALLLSALSPRRR
ncbi:ABC transporter permease [Nocardioides sp. C4-1]|uniref:ABC transporter permease n=1 Tax=Nocardioides sp. C4-1 TaxID=3151851 RepID=UPI003266F4A1